MSRAGGSRAIAAAVIISVPAALHGQSTPGWVHELGYREGQLHQLRVDHGYPLVTGVVNGQPVQLLFDTGDMVGVNLAPSLIKGLRLPRIGEWTSINSEGGVVARYGIYRADSVRVLGVTRRGESIYEFIDPDLPGLIGPGLLQGKRFTVDYLHGLLGVTDSPLRVTPPGVVPLVQSERHPELILVQGRLAEREVLIEIDSGKSRSTIDPELADELGLRISRSGAEIQALHVGSFTFSVPSAKLVRLRDIDPTLAHPILASLGSDLLRQVVWTVDYTRGILLLQRP